MSAQRQAFLPSELHPLSMIRMFWKRKFLIGVMWALGSVIAVGIVWTRPSIYSSEALILVDSQKIPERYVASTVSTDLQDRIATISQDILSSSQLKKIIDDFDLYKEYRKSLVQEEILDKMKKDITINLEKGWSGNRPGAFRIGYQGTDPAVVAQVANRMANLYVEENLKVREVQAEGTSEFMTTQLQGVQEASWRTWKRRLAITRGSISASCRSRRTQSAVTWRGPKWNCRTTGRRSGARKNRA